MCLHGNQLCQKKMERYFIQECIKLPEGTKVVELAIQPVEQLATSYKKCFTNCQLLHESNPGIFHPEICWIVCRPDEMLDGAAKNWKRQVLQRVGDKMNLCWQAELHCVLRRLSDGQLWDPSPELIKGKYSRRIVLEPRIGLYDILRWGVSQGGNLATIDNIGTPWTDEFFPKDEGDEDFFKVLAQLSR